MRYLIINQTSPFQNYVAQDALDLAIALSTFEQTVQLIFLGDGVLQLLKQQQANRLARKDFIKTFNALAMYDVTEVYVDATSMHNKMLSIDDLIMQVNIASTAQIAAFIAAADIVFCY